MDGTCNAMETCPITTYCYIATIGCYILLQRYDMLCHRGQGAGGPLIPDIGLEGGGPSDVGLNCSGLNWAGRL